MRKLIPNPRQLEDIAMAGSNQNFGQHYNNSAAASGPSRLPNPATDADPEILFVAS